MYSASPTCSAMPQPTVRQLTAFRFREKAATIAMNTTMPATAWRRGGMVSRRRNTAPPRTSASAAAARRSGVSSRRSAMRDPLHYERLVGWRRPADAHGALQQPPRVAQSAPGAMADQQDRVAGAD